jgi:hypothetical protein
MTSRRGRTLRIHHQEALLIELQAARRTAEGRQALPQRTAVEHTLSHFDQMQGKRARYSQIADDAGDELMKGVPLCSQDIPSMLPLLSSPLVNFFPLTLFERCVTWPRSVWRLPVALRPRVSNDLLSVQVETPVTRCSLRLATRVGRPVGGDPIYPTAALQGPEKQRAASTSPKAEA